MSRRTLVTLQDDLDGGPADRTVTFTWETTSYQIDLSTSHGDQLSAVIAPYIAAAVRRVGGRAPAGRRTTTSASAPRDKLQTQAIRSWAIQQGLLVSTRGRIPADTVTAWGASPLATGRARSTLTKAIFGG
jgi:hypothetical protein